MRTMGGPGSYDLYDGDDLRAAPPQNKGFSTEKRFRTFLKHDQPPPGLLKFFIYVFI